MNAARMERPVDSWYGRWQIRRMRAAYTAVTGWRSDQPGYGGLLEELQWGLAHLAPAERDKADDAVICAVLFGPLAVSCLRQLGTWLPQPTLRLFSFLSPWTFAFLTGPIQRTGACDLWIEECRFHQEGGDELCHLVCRDPVHRYFAWLRIPLTLTPDPASLRCSWHYGSDHNGSRESERRGE